MAKINQAKGFASQGVKVFKRVDIFIILFNQFIPCKVLKSQRHKGSLSVKELKKETLLRRQSNRRLIRKTAEIVIDIMTQIEFKFSKIKDG